MDLFALFGILYASLVFGDWRDIHRVRVGKEATLPIIRGVSELGNKLMHCVQTSWYGRCKEERGEGVEVGGWVDEVLGIADVVFDDHQSDVASEALSTTIA